MVEIGIGLGVAETIDEEMAEDGLTEGLGPECDFAGESMRPGPRDWDRRVCGVRPREPAPGRSGRRHHLQFLPVPAECRCPA